jgi:hypothetical protein
LDYFHLSHFSVGLLLLFLLLLVFRVGISCGIGSAMETP